ncbi:MAG: lipid-A-disaccharide synthase [Acidobacteria bacterium]|nr:MAG: lipid-A-disaccharide synthase [Acidobacteriota bacterium]
MPRLLISCGEASGDLYGAELVRHLRERTPDLDVLGLGGDRLQAQGASLFAHVRDLAVVGLLEVVSHLRDLRLVFRRILEEADRRPPDAAVLVDYPDFNLRLARALHRRGIPVIYYVSPQVWAWRRGRVAAIRETVARMLVIFPFEEPLYREAGVPVTFVGHPLVSLVRPAADPAAFLREVGLDPARPVVALLPGSRPKEVAHNLPPLAAAVDRVRAARPDAQYLAAVAAALPPGLVRDALRDRPVAVVLDRTHEALSAATAAVVASGTATVEAALLGTPMVVVYRLSPWTYRLGRRLVRVPYYAMVNLIAGRRVVPELIQAAFTPEGVAAELLPLLDETPSRQAMKAGLAEVREKLGRAGASARAADEIAPFLIAKKR